MNLLFFRGNRVNIQAVPTDEVTRKSVHEFWRYSQVSFLTRITLMYLKFDSFFLTTRERKSLYMC